VVVTQADDKKLLPLFTQAHAASHEKVKVEGGGQIRFPAVGGKAVDVVWHGAASHTMALVEVAAVSSDAVGSTVTLSDGATFSNPASKMFFQFKNLTAVPFECRLLKAELLTHDEKNWLDEYHCWVRESIGPLLAEGSDEKAWLLSHTAPLAEQLAKMSRTL
jgi:hypothetical protein